MKAKAAQSISRGMIIYYDDVLDNVGIIDSNEKFLRCAARNIKPFNAEKNYRKGMFVNFEIEKNLIDTEGMGKKLADAITLRCRGDVEKAEKFMQ